MNNKLIDIYMVLPAILILATSLAAAKLWYYPTEKTSSSQQAGLLTAIFGLLDMAALAGLSLLGLSYGQPAFPVFAITCVRFGLTAVLNLPLRITRQAPSKTTIHTGLLLLWILQGGILACEIQGLYIEPFRLTTSTIEVDGPAFFAERPLRIVQISDLHVERSTRREHAILAEVARLEPDMIVLTGDYLNLSYTHDEIAQRDAHAFLAQLHAPYGIYAISDNFVDPPDSVAKIFDGLDINVLYDKVVPLSIGDADLTLIGFERGQSEQRTKDHEVLTRLMAEVPSDAFTLLLYHSPDLIESAAAEGIDLYLAGHTHGGQIRLPFYGAIITSSVYGKRYEMGRYTEGETTLYVSRGLGMEGSVMPRVRFLCPPEIVVVDIAPATQP